MRRIFKKACVPVLISLCVCSCTDEWLGTLNPWNGKDREYTEARGFDNVFFAYLAGYNSLSSYINTNVSELAGGYIPGLHDNNAVVVFSHLKNSEGGVPAIFRLYSDNSTIVYDTLKVYPEGTASAKDSTLRDAMTFVENNFPASHYGLLMSSHGTGWLPLSYSLNSEERSWFNTGFLTVGNQSSPGNSRAYEIEITDFRDALPCHLHYIIFDACLMGGVETLYALRDCADYIVASPAEISAKGFDYNIMGNFLFRDKEVRLRDFCDSACVTASREGTVALYNCKYAQELAQAAKAIYSEHRSMITEINEDTLQAYNYSYNYNFDFREVCAAIGADATQMEALDSALKHCIEFKKASRHFLNFDIDSLKYSGISCYLPRTYRPVLNNMYKKCEWNIETHLLE